MKLISLILTIMPAAGTLLIVEKIGLVSLLPALAMEIACLFGLRKMGKAVNRAVLFFAMESAVLLVVTGSIPGSIGVPEELGWAATILAAVFHAAAYLTLCGFMLGKPGD